MYSINRVMSKLMMWFVLATIVGGCPNKQEERLNVLGSIGKAGGIELFHEKCATIALRMTTDDLVSLDFNDRACEELAAFIGSIPQLIVLSEDRRLLTIQLSGGFCHMGLIVKVSGGKLSEKESLQAGQVADTWRRSRMSELVFWYAE